jgi:hypothetical protein
LNSSENCRRTRRPNASFAIRDIVSTFQNVSTKSDQRHFAGYGRSGSSSYGPPRINLECQCSNRTLCRS